MRLLALALSILLLVYSQPALSAEHAATPVYDIVIHLDPPSNKMAVSGSVQVPVSEIHNRAITLGMGYFLEQGFAPTIAPGQGNLEIERIEPGDSDFDKRWTLVLNDAPLPENFVKIEFHYEYGGPPLPQVKISPEGSLAGSSGDPWYPQLAYTLLETGRLEFQVPAGDLVVAPGRKVSTPDQEKAGLYVFEAAVPVKFAFASGHYQKLSSEDGLFSLYFLSPLKEAEKFLQQTADAFSVLTGMYGPPPFGTSSLVEVDFPTIILGTSEAGFILADDSEFADFDYLYWAHEFAHQWLGIGVRSTPGDPAATLFTEGMAEFSAYAVLEALEGPEAAETARKGRFLEKYLKVANGGQDRALRYSSPKTQEEILATHRLSTSKGALVLAMLQNLIGKEAFFAGARATLADHAGSRATWADLEAAWSRSSGQNLDWFFDQWLGRAGIPSFHATWKSEDNEVTGVLTQTEPPYRAGLALELIGENGEIKSETIEINSEQQAFAFAPDFPVKNIRIDPRAMVFHLPEGRE